MQSKGFKNITLPIRGIFIALTLLLLIGLGSVKPTYAFDFTVTRFDDPPPGDCTSDDCSLREAVLSANANAGADTITLAAGTYNLTIPGTGENSALSGDLDITDDVVIIGSELDSTIIDGGDLDRVFQLFGAEVVEISNLTIRNGNAGSQSGGGVIVTDTNLTINRVTIRNNTTEVAGGGIFSNGELMITNSTISHNSADSGGGIVTSNGFATLFNSTVSSNMADNAGGGILTLGAGVRLVNVTVSHNDASSGGGIHSDGAGMLSIANTIVAAQRSGEDCFGDQIFSAGYNLDSDGTCLAAPQLGDLPNGDALLGPLQNHGGLTETHALLPGSEAIDAAHTPTCAAPVIGNLDQRAQPRPVDGNEDETAECDIGAYELDLYGEVNSPLGTNLGPVLDWSTQLPFVDVFKMARPWNPECAAGVPNCAEALNAILDEDGWPTELSPSGPVISVQTYLLFGDEEGQNNQGGDYLELYYGEGTIEYLDGLDEDGPPPSPGSGVIAVAEDGFVHLRISDTSPDNHIRNIRFIKQEYESTYQTHPFNPAFLDRVKNFRVLRFMDWMRTNHTPTGTWAERAQVNDYTYTTQNGVPLEVMLALANQTRKAPWFNMPHLAHDDYISEFAAVVRDNLDSDLPVYIEYSNETWNPGFPHQNGFVRVEGMDEFGTNNAWQAGLNYHGMRAAQMCLLWHEVWGAEADRIICVAASQAGNHQTANEVLDCPLWDEPDEGGEDLTCVEYGGVDTLAIAPYFGNYIGQDAFADQIGIWLNEPDGGMASLFDEINQVALPQAVERMDINYDAAAEHGVDLIAYEGGQHLAINYEDQSPAFEAAAAELFAEANRHPQMGIFYSQYLHHWRASRGCLFANYTLAQNIYSESGSWGILEFINQAASPKYAAVMEFIDVNPWPWTGENECGAGQEGFLYQYLPAIFQS